jgi:hypothetical protein
MANLVGGPIGHGHRHGATFSEYPMAVVSVRAPSLDIFAVHMVVSYCSIVGIGFHANTRPFLTIDI